MKGMLCTYALTAMLIGGCSETTDRRCAVAGHIVESCRANDEPATHAFELLTEMTPKERASFSAEHNCGHDPERFGLDCIEEATGCTTRGNCSLRQLEYIALLVYQTHLSPHELERAVAATYKISEELERRLRLARRRGDGIEAGDVPVPLPF